MGSAVYEMGKAAFHLNVGKVLQLLQQRRQSIPRLHTDTVQTGLNFNMYRYRVSLSGCFTLHRPDGGNIEYGEQKVVLHGKGKLHQREGTQHKNILGNANGAVTGVDLELAKLIADEIGVELEIVDMNFDLLIDSLKSGKGDLVAAGMTATAARAEIIDFSTIYISLGLKVVVPANTDIKSFDDIDGKKVAVQESTTADIFAQEHYKNSEILGFKTAIDACNAVKSGNVDCAVVDMLPAEYMTTNSPDIDLMEGLVSAEETAMAVAKGHEDLLAVVNQVLEKAMADGTLDALFNKHMENFAL